MTNAIDPKFFTSMEVISFVSNISFPARARFPNLVLNTYITETTWQAFDEVTSNPGVYEEVILTEETVENGEKYQLVKRKTKK